MNSVQKFGFDTRFDGDGEVIAAQPRIKRVYSAQEAEALRQEAYRQGEAAAAAALQGEQARALAALAEAARSGLSALSQVAHNHRVHAAGLAMACGRAIADSALAAFPQAPLETALESLAREFNDAPRLTLRVGGDVTGLSEAVEAMARDIGFPGQVVLKNDPGLPAAAFSLDWGDGSAVFNPETTAARIADAVAAALAAERLHADPIDLSSDGEP